MPDTPGWGKLAGKYVRKDIFDRLISRTRSPEGFEKILTQLTGKWKAAKVIANPATQVRNFITNMMLAHNALGVRALNPLLWRRAFKEVTTNGAAFREAKSVSAVFVDTFTKSELSRLAQLEPGSRFARVWNWPMEKGSSLYQFTEQWAKMAIYLGAREFSTPKAAADLAGWALFNYQAVPQWVNTLRRKGFYPFIVFPYKVATETIPLALDQGLGRFSQQAKAIQKLFSEPLTEEERKSLPARMRSGGYIKLKNPLTGNPVIINGHPVLLDLTYILPWGDIGEGGSIPSAIAKTIQGSPDLRDFLPLLTPFGQTAAELGLNRSAFTQRDIVPEGETAGKAWEERARYVGRQILPSWVPAALYPSGQLHRTITGKVSRTGEPPQPLRQSIPGTFLGLRTVPLDVRRERAFRASELQRAVLDIQRRIASVATDQSIPSDAKRRRLEAYRRELQELIRRYNETGTIER